MRKPIIISALPPLLISLTALLWLLWGFVPLATAIKWLITAGMKPALRCGRRGERAAGGHRQPERDVQRAAETAEPNDTRVRTGRDGVHQRRAYAAYGHKKRGGECRRRHQRGRDGQHDSAGG